MTVTWPTILERFNLTSLSLQKVEIDLLSIMELYDSRQFFYAPRRGR